MNRLIALILVFSSCFCNAQELVPAREHLLNLQEAAVSTQADLPRAKTTAGVFDTLSWAANVDSYWGSGLPTATKLSLFDLFWSKIDSAYPCFVHLPLYNWDSIVNAKRNEINQGVSKGRFAGIMSDLLRYINDGHTNFTDVSVNFTSPIAFGVPLFRSQSGRFGACITALNDTTAMVYEVVPNHPFGLQQGDIILGYNGIPWAELVKIALRHQLPNNVLKGSTASATWQKYIKAAGENWYLFDTINIRKCNGSIVNAPTSLMVGTSFTRFCTDQMPVPGVPRLSYQDFIAQKAYSSGVITGTSIGYVYMYDCTDMSGDSLYNRVRALVEDSLVSALVLDIRTNFGGSIRAFDKTFEYLHDGNVSWLGYGERSDPFNRLSMVNNGLPAFYDVQDGDPAFFNKPIALLTGPQSISAGDLLPVLFQHHPMVRSFGRPTAGAFGAYWSIPSGVSGISASRQSGNFFEPTNPNYYLSHTEYPVDQLTWLNRDSVCAGRDNVVSEAIAWISQATGITKQQKAMPAMDIFPVPSHGKLTISLSWNKEEQATITITDLAGRALLHHGLSLQKGSNVIHLDLRDQLTPGHYLIKVSGSGSSAAVGRFLKD